MAGKPMPAAGRLIIVLLSFAAIGSIVYFTGLWNKISGSVAPAGKQTESILIDTDKESTNATDGAPAAAAAKDDGAKADCTVCVVTWGGYVGGQYFNGGFTPSRDSRFFKEYGITVRFRVIDDYDASRKAWMSGECDLLWTTADSFDVEAGGHVANGTDPQVVFQSDWSRGGDAIVVVHGINSVRDLKGRKIAVAPGTPSNTLLLITLQSNQMEYSDVKIVTVPSAIEAAAAFKSGAVDAAVVWSPDDDDCVNTVTGSKVLINTTKATFIIADVFYAKKAWIESHGRELQALIEGWLRGAAEINTDPKAKEAAVRVLMAGLNLDEKTARNAINNVRLTTYGDNLNFFGLNPNYKGVKGEDLYNKMTRLYTAIKLVSGTVPPWRSVTNLTALRAITKLTGPSHLAEGQMVFTPPTKVEETAPATATFTLPNIRFATGSSTLDENAKTLVDMSGVGDQTRMFGGTRYRVWGHTDDVGNLDMNMRLSKARAEALVDYLVAKYGFDRNRFVVDGKGPTMPLCEDKTEACRAKNRRTEFQQL